MIFIVCNGNSASIVQQSCIDHDVRLKSIWAQNINIYKVSYIKAEGEECRRILLLFKNVNYPCYLQSVLCQRNNKCTAWNFMIISAHFQLKSFIARVSRWVTSAWFLKYHTFYPRHNGQKLPQRRRRPFMRGKVCVRPARHCRAWAATGNR